MKQDFSNKYMYYCKERDKRDEILWMDQWENESLEDYEEISQSSYKRDHNCTLDEDSLKNVLLRGVREELMEILSLISNGYFFQLGYDNIK